MSTMISRFYADVKEYKEGVPEGKVLDRFEFSVDLTLIPIHANTRNIFMKEAMKVLRSRPIAGDRRVQEFLDKMDKMYAELNIDGSVIGSPTKLNQFKKEAEAIGISLDLDRVD